MDKNVYRSLRLRYLLVVFPDESPDTKEEILDGEQVYVLFPPQKIRRFLVKFQARPTPDNLVRFHETPAPAAVLTLLALIVHDLKEHPAVTLLKLVDWGFKVHDNVVKVDVVTLDLTPRRSLLLVYYAPPSVSYCYYQVGVYVTKGACIL